MGEEDAKWQKIEAVIKDQMTRAVEIIASRESQIGARAMETASRVEGTLMAHLKHHDQMEAEARESREALRKSIGKVHTRINLIGIGIIGILLSMVAYLVTNGAPWAKGIQ